MAAKELIQTITVGSGGAASIEFTSIPQTGTDLLVVFSIRSSFSGVDGDLIGMQLNADTTTANYGFRYLYGQGGSAASVTFSANYVHAGFGAPTGVTANTFGNGQVCIPNYTASTAKSFSTDTVYENNETTAYQNIAASKWTGTAGITSIKLFSANSATIAQYSSASLYKFTKGSGGATVA
jgi:hypothetical protein